MNLLTSALVSLLLFIFSANTLAENYPPNFPPDASYFCGNSVLNCATYGAHDAGPDPNRCSVKTCIRNPSDDNCSGRDTYSLEANACVPYQAPPEECQQLGQYYENGTCVDECTNGRIDGICLNLPHDDPENPCDPSSSDLIAISDGISICSNESQCPGGSQGLVNGELVCLPPADDLPTCEAGTITIISQGDGGYVCASPSDTPQGPLRDEDGNAVDSEGNPDFNPEASDLTSTDGTVTDSPGIQQTERNTRETAENTARANELLEQIANNTANGEAPCDPSAHDCPATMDDLLERVDSRAVIPDELSLAPTFVESSEYFWTQFSATPLITTVTAVPAVSTNNTCPIFSDDIPILGRLTIDVHCQVFSDHRATLSILFKAVWLLTALVIFLRA